MPPEVTAAMSLPVLHHRSPDFKALLADALVLLRRAFDTESEVLIVSGSGTAGMESAVVNLVSPGDRVVVVSAGNFGERWADLCEAYGADLAHDRRGWGERLTGAHVAAALEAAPGATAVFVTHSETSTGVVHDVEGIAAVVRETDAVLVVDAVSSLGGVELATDRWGVDVVVAGSQKALMTPPGLAFVAAGERARMLAERSRTPRLYLDWKRGFVAQAAGTTAFTPAVTLVAGLVAALRLVEARGYPETWAWNRRLARAARAGVKALGLRLLSPDDESAAMVTAFHMPDGVDGQAVYAALRDDHGVVLAGGQGPLRGRIMRIGHMGYMDGFDMLTALAALEWGLARFGHAPPEPGAGVARAAEVLGSEAV